MTLLERLEQLLVAAEDYSCQACAEHNTVNTQAALRVTQVALVMVQEELRSCHSAAN